MLSIIYVVYVVYRTFWFLVHWRLLKFETIGHVNTVVEVCMRETCDLISTEFCFDICACTCVPLYNHLLVGQNMT